MTATVLFAGAPRLRATWLPALKSAFDSAGMQVRVILETDRPQDVSYILYSPGGTIEDFSIYPRLKAVLSLWAGVEEIVLNPTIRVPLTRMVDGNLTQSMVEYVVGHALRYHLGIDRYLLVQDGEWRQASLLPPLASERTVAFLGLGELGGTCATTLASLGFQVIGWSRRPKSVDGISTEHGASGLYRTLQSAGILVLLLPLTPSTKNILGHREFAHLPKGSRLINPGRGQLIDDCALLAALDSGRLEHATLDVFREEPLPPDHAFWRHPGITVTPHIAADTTPESASHVVAENVRRGETGLPFIHVVNRDLAY